MVDLENLLTQAIKQYKKTQEINPEIIKKIKYENDKKESGIIISSK